MNDYKRLSSGEMRDDFTKKAKQKYQNKNSAFRILKKVFFYAKEYRIFLYIALFMDVVNTVCNIMMPIFVGKCINCIVSKGNVDFTSLYKNIIIVAAFAIGAAISYFSQKLCLSHYNYKGTFKIRDLLFEKFQDRKSTRLNSSHR